MGVTFCTPSFSFPLPLFFFFSAELGRLGCLYPFIDRAVCLNSPHSGGHLSWMVLLCKQNLPTHIPLSLSLSCFLPLSPSFCLFPFFHTVGCDGDSHFSREETNTNTVHLRLHKITLLPHTANVALFVSFWPHFQRLCCVTEFYGFISIRQ